MRTSQAARYARWAAVVAVLLAATVAGVYAHRAWLAAQAQRKAPPVVPPSVQQRSAEFAFSKVEKDRTLFTVRASRATEFKDQNKSLLEDVWITIYGQQGGRYDNLHTRECNYEPSTGRIVCQGDVQMDLESAQEARAQPGQRVIHLATRNVTFDRNTGEAGTEQPVEFRFPYGAGRAVGVTYRTRDASILLHRDVHFTLTAANQSQPPVQLTGGSLEYRRNDRSLRLLSPVRVTQGSRELTAGSVVLELDEDLRARRAVASGAPRLVSAEPRGRATLEADQFTALFHPDGWVQRVVAEGHVRGNRTAPAGEDDFEAQRVDVEMSPRENQPRELIAQGDVQLRTTSEGRAQRLDTATLHIAFLAGQRASQRRITAAETLAPATLEWTTPAETAQIQAQRIAASFDEHNRIRQLFGHAGVQVRRQVGSAAPQFTSSQELVLAYGAGNQWSEVDQSGNVSFRQGNRAAHADRARLERASDRVILAGSAVAADAASRTAAQLISFNQGSGEIRAEGNVRTTYLSSESDATTNLAPEPASIAAQRLLANSTTGRAVYSGGARLWQGDAVIQAESIELLRDERRLEASDNVLANFPQSPGSSGQAAGPTIWRVRADHLTYLSEEGKAHLEGTVTAKSRQGQIDAQAMDLFLTRQAGGPAQLSRATATGQVTVRQGDRRGSSERASYSVSDGKFVLSGGEPTLYDASGDITKGRQLTFFLSSDKILVDSDAGSRTVTRHRVEK